MKKSGQVTLFVILGLVILIVLGLVMSMRSHKDNVSSNNIFDDSAIENCAMNLAPEGIYSLAFNGGYLYDFNDVTTLGNVKIANHRVYDKITAPSDELMESDLSRFMLEGLKSCLGVDISSVKTTIIDKKAVFDIIYNGHVYSHIQDSDMGLMIKDAKSLRMKSTELVAALDKSDSGFNIDTIPYDSDTTIYSMKKINSLVFNFAVTEKKLRPDFLFNLDNRLTFDSKNPETVLDNMKATYKLVSVGSIGVIKAGGNGGLIEASDKTLHLGSSSVKCHIIKDKAVQFSKADVESSIAKYIKESFSTDDSMKDMDISVDIQDVEVIITGVNKDSTFQVKVPAPLGELIKYRNELVSNLEKGTPHISKDGISLTIQVVSSEDMIYRLLKQSDMGNYEFNLGVCND